MVDWNSNVHYVNAGKVMFDPTVWLIYLGDVHKLFLSNATILYIAHPVQKGQLYIFYATKTPTLLMLSPNTWISFSHFFRGFLMDINSQILRFLLGQVSITKPKGRWHAAPAWGPRGPSSHSPSAQALLSRHDFTQDIFCKHMISCCQLEMSQEFSCYWLCTARIK